MNKTAAAIMWIGLFLIAMIVIGNWSVISATIF